MTSKFPKLLILAAAVASSVSCGDFVRQGRSPVILVVKSLQAASGADPTKMGGTLASDVVTMRTSPDPCTDSTPCPTVWADPASVILGIQLKDQGSLNVIAEPSLTNQVTIDRYHVEYRRADGHNAQGVDVPFAWDSAFTITVPPDEDAVAGFQIVRQSAKSEAPLRALIQSGNIISTIAVVTFYGHDQAGNQVSASANIGIDFADFADPD